MHVREITLMYLMYALSLNASRTKSRAGNAQTQEPKFACSRVLTGRVPGHVVMEEVPLLPCKNVKGEEKGRSLDPAL